MISLYHDKDIQYKMNVDVVKENLKKLIVYISRDGLLAQLFKEVADEGALSLCIILKNSLS